MKPKIISLILALSFLGAKATNISLDQAIKLSPDQKSQTISISLDSIPSKQTKKGVVKDGKIKLAFKLSKKDKKKFTLDPKNGKLNLQVKDGKIQPASLTITAKETTELGEYNYKIQAAKKFRKEISNIEDSLEYNNVKTIKGSVDLTALDAQPSRIKSLVNLADLTVEIFRLDPNTRQLGEELASGTTDQDGNFTLTVPSTEDFGASMICQTQVPDSQDMIRTFLSNDKPILNPESEFLTEFILNSSLDLNNIDNVFLDNLYDLVNDQNPSGNTLSDIKSDLDTKLANSLNTFVNNQGSAGNIELPNSFDSFDIDFSIGQAIIGDNAGQPILGQHFGVTVTNTRKTVEGNQNGVFEIKSEPVRVNQTNSISTIGSASGGNEIFSVSDLTGSEADNFNFDYLTVNSKDNCLLQELGAKTQGSGDATTERSSQSLNKAFSSPLGLIAGVGDAAVVIDKVENEELARIHHLAMHAALSNSDFDPNVKNLKNPNLKFSSLTTALTSLPVLLGFSALSVDINRLGMARATSTLGACDASVLAALTVYRAECEQVSTAELDIDRAAAQYIYEGLDSLETLDGFEFGNYDWELAKADDNFISTEFEIKPITGSTKNDDSKEGDLILAPVFGSPSNVDVVTGATSAFRYRDIVMITDTTRSLSEEASNEAASAKTFVDVMSGIRAPGDQVEFNDTNFKIYGISFQFAPTAASLIGISGTVTIDTNSNNTYDWTSLTETYDIHSSSLNNSNPNNLGPTVSQDTVTNQSATSIFDSGLGAHQFSNLHGTTRRCQFPNENFFYCQVSSSNLSSGASTETKSVGVVYGVRVEEN